VITHNATTGKIAHRVVTLADGKVHSTEVNEERIAPEELSW
jgi:putative ABC transport system ATP-binding protein